MANSIFHLMNDLQQKQQAFAIATVVDTYGSVSAKTSSKAIIDANGKWVLPGFIDNHTLGYRIVVNDLGATRDKFPMAAEIITDDLDYSQLQPKQSDYVIIATQHKGDHESIKQALRCNAGYIALIASRKRARLVLDYLREEQLSEEDIARVVAPSGLDLGPKTPEEIALCILSEITMLRRGGSGMRNCDKLVVEDAQNAKAAAKLKNVHAVGG